MSDTATQASPSKKRPPHPWLDFFREPLGRVQAESRAFLASDASRRLDGKVILVLLTAVLALTVQQFVAMPECLEPIAAMLRGLGLLGLAADLAEATSTQLGRLTWWSVISLLVYVAVPMLVVRFVFRERLRDYGLKLGAVFADFWFYALLMDVAWPAIFLASGASRFQETYPFYHPAPDERAWPNLVQWEFLYTLQFFAVEFLFRGFLVHGLKHRFGAYAIFVMMVPYCMLHFGKPLTEALAAILGAIVLGFMSLRTRSIWMGIGIHVSVAWSMDAAVLWRQGFFG